MTKAVGRAKRTGTQWRMNGFSWRGLWFMREIRLQVKRLAGCFGCTRRIVVRKCIRPGMPDVYFAGRVAHAPPPNDMFQPAGMVRSSITLDLFPRFCFFLADDGMSEPVLDLERDVNLLRRIADGDRSAFASFYDLYSGLLFSIAVKVLNDTKEAEDVLQEVFMQIWNKAGDYDPLLGKPASWAVTLTRNKAIDRIRASQRRSKLIEQATVEAAVTPDNTPSANEKLHGKENAARVRSVVAELPPEQRRAIELAFFSGLTQDEISKTLREPLGTIKARIRRGMLKLREKLEGFV